jgi:hypothetical protein
MLTNSQGDYFEAGVWSTVELDVGIICLCMPNLRIILIYIFPSLGSTTYKSSDKHVANDKYYCDRTHNTKALGSNDIRTGVSDSMSYRTEYTMKPAQDESSCVQLVDLEVASEQD